jgi:DNA-binding LacI/PurR family transcriptional regulator
MSSREKSKNPDKVVAAREIAEALGVSVSTVSRAFSRDSKVASETRDMILEYAKTVGYQPNPMARSLITNRSGIVSIFISDIFNPFFPEALTALTDTLQQSGWNVMLMHVPSGKTPDDILPQAMAYKPEFIILMTATVAFQAAMATAKLGSHLIFFNRYVPNTEAFSVVCDNAKGGWEVADFLIRTGHRRMAYIAGTPDATTSIDRGRGFVERCRESGLDVLIDEGSRVFSYEDGYTAVQRVIKKAPDRDGIFCGNDIIAMGVIDALQHELGRRVPDDISVVGFDDVSMASWPSHGLTTYHYPVGRVVEATVGLIKEIEENPGLRPMSKVVPGWLVIRNTHRDRRRCA